MGMLQNPGVTSRIVNSWNHLMMMQGFMVVPVGSGWSEEYNVIASVDRKSTRKTNKQLISDSAIGRLLLQVRYLCTFE
jgi:hypothetical protein